MFNFVENLSWLMSDFIHANVPIWKHQISLLHRVHNSKHKIQPEGAMVQHSHPVSASGHVIHNSENGNVVLNQ